MSGESKTDGRSDPRGSRWSLFGFAMLLILLSLVVSAPAAPHAESQIKVTRISQAGKSLILQVRSERQVALSELRGFPNVERRKARYLCSEFRRAGRRGISRICLGGRRPHHIVSVSRVRPNGNVVSKDTITAAVKRSGARKLVITFDPAEAGLVPASYGWRTIYSDGKCPADIATCQSARPARGFFSYRVRPVRPVSCSSGGNRLYTHGRNNRKQVALTFDDGPSLYTGDILRILGSRKVKATFFQLGSEVARYPAKARAVLAAGHEIGNHSTSHALLPSAGDIANTSHVIKAVTGFRTCDFRPPYGAVNSTLVAAAGASGMSTVNWDVDTVDWQQPGAAAIRARIKSGVRPGSIVLMHDGGGPRSGTVEALSGAIHSLRKRGYRFVTVSEILGGRTFYSPVR